MLRVSPTSSPEPPRCRMTLLKLPVARLAALALFAAVAAAVDAAPAADPPKIDKVWVFVGTYTGDKSKSKGIYRCEMDLATGKLSEPELAVEAKSPSFLAVHPGQQYLYAVSEVGDFGGKKSGAVNAFA